MRMTLNFSGGGKATIDLRAETDAEKAMLAFLAEGKQKRWAAFLSYNYRAGGCEQIQLVEQEILKETQ